MNAESNSTLRRSSSRAAALMLCSLSGCGIGEFFGIFASTGKRPAQGSQGAPELGAQDRYIKMTGRNKEPAGGRIGFLQVPRELWAPFRHETSVGFYDNEHVADRGIICTELGRTGSPPSRFFGRCAQILPGGLNVYAYAHTSGSPIGTRMFAGATEVDFAIEADTSTLTFLARESGEPAWLQIATHPFSGQVLPLFPSIGVSGIGKQQVVGFDNYRLVANSPPRAPQTLEQDLAGAIWLAVDRLIEASHGLDGGAPDFAAAAVDLDAAETHLIAAKTLAAGIAKRSLRSKIKGWIRRARAELDHASSLVGRQKKAGAAIGDLKVSMKFGLKAIFKLTPLPDPDP